MIEVNNLNKVTESAVLLIDKPYGWTSFDVVGKIRVLIRQLTGERNVKVGHAGTLDPLATGLLIICTGKATKQSSALMSENKEYVATLKLGETTPSFDLETEPDAQYPTNHITAELINRTISDMIGKQEQTPPLFSAKYINGKRAYKYARKGVDVELEPVPIEIFNMEVISFETPLLKLKIFCSKGTYIRALARDIGQKLESGAHLVELRRTASGTFNIDQALTINDIEKNFLSMRNQ